MRVPYNALIDILVTFCKLQVGVNTAIASNDDHFLMMQTCMTSFNHHHPYPPHHHHHPHLHHPHPHQTPETLFLVYQLSAILPPLILHGQ